MSGDTRTSFTVRDATTADVPAITAIYNALVPTHTVAWTEELDTIEHRMAWFAYQQSHAFPVLVAEREGVVVGFTSFGYFRGEGKWPGYRETMEHSIHVRGGHWGIGIGRALLQTLLDRARDAGVHVMVAAVDGENADSLRFHQRLGFVEVARMPQTGQKFGRWLDLVLMQCVLDDREKP